MSTVATIHLQSDELETLQLLLTEFGDEFDVDTQVVQADEWLSVHSDHPEFALQVDELGRALSRALKTRVVTFGLFEPDLFACSCFKSGRAQATVLVKEGEKPNDFEPAKWKTVGLDAKLVKALGSKHDDIAGVADLIADGLGIPLDTVLAQGPSEEEEEFGFESEPARSKPSKTGPLPKPPKGAEAVRPPLIAEWEALRLQAEEVDIELPTFEVWVADQLAAQAEIDDDAVRAALLLYRAHVRR